jgi:uncharacterized protein YlxP (DUF503 family)
MATVAFVTIELHIAEARSLKDKRMVVRSVKDRLKKHNVAVAEIDHQDLWQRATIGVAAVGSDDAIVEQTLSAAMNEVEAAQPGVVLRTNVEYLR